jgi:putative N6-adenine-specific DNA methylase
MTPEHIFAACAPGLERVLAGELRALGLEARPLTGGVDARGDGAVALTCLAARTAESVVLRLYDGPERHVDAALRDARRRVGARPLAIRRSAGRATISLDAVGEPPLYKRGWRARVGAAPLRETVAAGLLLLARHDGARPLLDPMCGSGTIAIEAALLGARRAPGLARSFAFESWPWQDQEATALLRARLAREQRAGVAPIHASDRNAGALRIAAKNAEAAGIAGAIRFERLDAAQRTIPPGPGLLAVNPPFGVRLDRETAEAWRSLGRLMERAQGWNAVVLAPDRGYERLLPRAPNEVIPVRLGGLRCQILLFGP